MVNRIILVAGALAIALAVSVCVHATTAIGKTAAEPMIADDTVVQNKVVSKTEATQDSRITENDAKRIALERVGLDEKDVTFLQVQLDYDDGKQYYDVEFYHDIEEYDFEIDAYTGDVLEFDYDIENYEIDRNPEAETPAQPADPKPTTPQPAVQDSAKGAVTEEAAKKTALARAGVKESDTSYLYVVHEYDDGLSFYNVEFQVGTMEYECEIDANSGAVIEYDAESIYD